MIDNPVNDMANAIVAVVEARDWVTFAELDRYVPGFQHGPGDTKTLCLGPKVVWQASDAGFTALCKAWDEGRVCAAGASVLAYIADGTVLHGKDWLPLSLRPGRFTNYHTPAPGNLAFYVDDKTLKSVTRKLKRRDKDRGRAEK